MISQPVKKLLKHKLSKEFKLLERTILRSLSKKYQIDENYYNSRMINDIVFNRRSHIVAAFKNHLIHDDESEFLNRFYNKKDSMIKLTKLYDYYETFSKIFPNYTSLTESKFIYKNIHKKQKMIDQQQKQEYNDKKKHKVINENISNEVFSTDVYTSIVNDNDDIVIIFDLKNKSNDIEDEINKLIDVVTSAEKSKEILKSNRKSMSSNNSSSNIEKFLNKNILTPRVSYYPSKIINRLNSNKRHESARMFSKEEITNNSIALNDSNRNIVKNIRNQKSKLSNSSLSSAHRKNNLSTTLSQKKQAPNSNYINFKPITRREEVSKNLQNNHNNNNDSCLKQEHEVIKVNICSIKATDSMRLKKNIITKLKDGNKKFILHSNITTQIKPTIKLGNKIKEHIFSPQITKRNGEMNYFKEVSQNNSINNSKASLKRNKTDRIENSSNAEVLGKSENKDQKLNYHNSDKKISTKQSPENRGNSGMNTTRPKSRTAQQMNNSNIKQPNLNNNHEKNKVIISCNLAIGKSSIKEMVKGFQIKRFNKALRLSESPIKKKCGDMDGKYTKRK